MKHRDYIVIGKIADEIKIAMELLGDLSPEDFYKDEKTKRAICMTVINVGELIKVISTDIREKYKEIPWKEAAGFRDIAAHKYQTLDMGDVYKTIKDDFPELLNKLQEIRDMETDDYDN